MVNSRALWVRCLSEETSVVKANPTGAGYPGVQTSGRWTGLWIAKIAQGQKVAALGTEQVFPIPNTCPTPQPTLAKICTLKVLEKGKFILWKRGSNRSSFCSFIFD